MLKRKWQTINLKLKGPLWTLCQTIDQLGLIFEAFQRENDPLLESRSDGNPWFVEHAHQSLLTRWSSSNPGTLLTSQ